MRLLAIDPGPQESALLIYDTELRQPVGWFKVTNEDAVLAVAARPKDEDHIAIEMVASYGMAVGAEVFETCVWIGRFIECWKWAKTLAPDHTLVYRRDVKLHLCGSARAKDANIRQAIIDRYGGKEKAVGRKAAPGPLYGISGDVWSALAVAITAAEQRDVEAAA
jgi:hypothetical protein